MTLGPPGPLNATVKYRGSTKNDRARARMSSCSQEKRGWGISVTTSKRMDQICKIPSVTSPFEHHSNSMNKSASEFSPDRAL